MLKRLIVWVIIVILLALCSVATYRYYKSHQNSAAGAANTATSVTIAPATATTWKDQIKATGTVSAQSGVMLKAETAGKITKIYVSSSEQVKLNQPLIQINPDSLNAQYQEAQSQQLLMATEYKRQQAMRAKNIGVAADFDKAKADLIAARAKLVSIKAQLDQTLISAPFPGRLGLMQVEVGDYVAPGQALVSLQNLKVLRVEFNVSEKDLAKLALGQKVSLTTPAFANKIFTGKVFAIDAIVDPNTRMVSVRAIIDKPPANFLPGLFGQVVLTVNEKRNAVVIPRTALSYAVTGDTVFKVVNGKAIATVVKLGEARNEVVEVLSGIKAGDQIVTIGALKLKDGANVVNKK